LKVTAGELAVRLGGRVDGDSCTVLTGLAGLGEAGPGDLSFLANPRYGNLVSGTRASAVIVHDKWDGKAPCALIRVENPDAAFASVAAMAAPVPPAVAAGIDPSAVVAPDARLGDGVCIGPLCIIRSGVEIGSGTVLMGLCYVGDNSRIGEDCRLHPNVSLRERVSLGNRVIVHNGAVIGSDGFGYFRTAAGWNKIPQTGTVEIGDDVEIGANVTIDRARFGKTVIARGVKMDNLVQVAHNVRIGEHTAIAAQAGISGSTTIGRNVQIGGQAGVAGHTSVGDGAIIGAQAGVTKSVADGSFVSGYPAMPHDKARKLHAMTARLPDLRERVAGLEKRLKALEDERTGGAR